MGLEAGTPEAIEIIEKLDAIDDAIKKNTAAVRRSKISIWLQWLTILSVILIAGITWKSDQKRTAEREKKDCLISIEAREDNRQRLLFIADEIQSQRLTDLIDSSYEDSAPPAACL
jgi:hypothetical protein